MVDATIVKVHCHGQGAKGRLESGYRPRQARHDDQDTGLTDALGTFVRFVMRRYSVWIRRCAPLIEGIEFGALIADKAFDSNDIIANLNERGAKIVISQHPRRTVPLQIDTEMYKWRHLIVISSASSRNSNASPCVPTKPTRASKR